MKQNNLFPAVFEVHELKFHDQPFPRRSLGHFDFEELRLIFRFNDPDIAAGLSGEVVFGRYLIRPQTGRLAELAAEMYTETTARINRVIDHYTTTGRGGGKTL